MPDLVGVSHIDFTVTDGEQSAQWWSEVLGFTLVNRYEGDTFTGWSTMHPTGLVVTLITHNEQLTDSFDERRHGLDHFALMVRDRDELVQWAQHLDEHGVNNSGVIDAPFGPTLVFRDPDNIQLELFVPDAASVDAAMEFLRNEGS